MSDIKEVKKQSAGGSFYEVVRRDKKLEFCFYHPEGLGKEHIEYDDFHPLGVQGDTQLVEYPLRNASKYWAVCTEPRPPDSDLDEQILNYLTRYYELPDESMYYNHVGWVKSSWIPEMYHVAPYLFFHGQPDTGKTQAQETLRQLVFRGILSADMSEAMIFRLIDKHRPTVFIDEAESLNTKERAKSLNLLNSGYKRGYTVWRASTRPEDDFEPTSYDLFGFKCLASTERLSRTTESRCLPTVMEIASREIESPPDPIAARDIRNQLLWMRWRILYEAFKPPNDLYSSYTLDTFDTPKRGKMPEMKGVKNRLYELYAPLVYSLNSTPYMRNEVVAYAYRAAAQALEDDRETEEAQVVSALLKALVNQSSPSKFVPTQSVTLWFNAEKTAVDQKSEDAIGIIFRRLGFNSKSNGTLRGRSIDPDRLRRLCDRYKFTYPENW
jgi:hypothetical protein